MNKTAIKNFAVWARNKLIADISYEAVKAHYKVRLSSKKFTAMNVELSRKWTEILNKVRVEECTK